MFAGIYGTLLHGVVNGASEVMDIPMVSFFAGSLVLITVTLKMLLMISHYTLPIFLALGISMAGYVIVFIGLEVVGLLEPGVFAAMHSMPLYYLGLLVIPIGCLLPDYTIAYVMRQYFPSDAQIIQEDQRIVKMKQRQLAIAAASGSPQGIDSENGGGSLGAIKGKKKDDLEDREAMVDTRSAAATRQGDSFAPDYEDDEEVEEEEEDEEEDENEMVGVVVQGPDGRYGEKQELPSYEDEKAGSLVRQ